MAGSVPSTQGQDGAWNLEPSFETSSTFRFHGKESWGRLDVMDLHISIDLLGVLFAPQDVVAHDSLLATDKIGIRSETTPISHALILR